MVEVERRCMKDLFRIAVPICDNFFAVSKGNFKVFVVQVELKFSIIPIS